MKLDDRRVTTYLPVVVLVLFALFQIDRAHRFDQSPWQGGGFGMFSTNDRVSLRQLRVVASTDGEEVLVRLSPRLRGAEKRLASLPRERDLVDFARMLFEQDELAAVDTLRVEVWRTEFDSASSTARLVKLREATHRRAD